MPANGKAADDGRVIDLAEATRTQLAAKADKSAVVAGIKTSDGAALPIVAGVVTLPAPESTLTTADLDALIGN